MRIYPGRPLHDGRALGGLQPDEHVPGLFVIGEANFSDHGANRLGASALMQGLADGYFILPSTIGDYLASAKPAPVDATHPEFRGSRPRWRSGPRRCSSISGKRTVDSFHRELGQLMWDYCGMARNAAGLQEALGADPGAARGVLAERQRARQRRRAQPVAREGRPGRRLPGAGRADVPRRAAPARSRAAATSARSTRPRTARPCATTSTSPTSRPGSTPATGRRPDSTRSRSSSSTCTWRSGATSESSRLHVWRQPGPNAPGGWSGTRRSDISPDMSFLEMLDVVNERLMERARSRSPSTTTAARGSAARAA